MDESSYARTVYTLAIDETDDDFDDSAEGDERVYKLVQSGSGLSEINQSLADLKAATKYYSPRIQAHYQYYDRKVAQFYTEKVAVQFQYDSFGGKVKRGKSGRFAWLHTGDRVYCTADDLFALQLGKKSDLSAEIQPFDRVIGSNTAAPLLVLYGDLYDDGFKSMFSNLYQSAEAGKLRFVWRYVPGKTKAREQLPNYAATMVVRRLQDNPDLLSGEGVADIGLRLASRILSHGRPEEAYRDLLKTVQNIPATVNDVVSEHLDPSVRAAKANEDMGVGDDTLGIYLNGAPINLLELDTFKLINRVEEEVHTIQSVMDLGFTLDQARTLLTKFALHSAVRLSEFNQGGDVSRYKVYEHAYVAGKGAKRGGVVFLNDIELDDNYEHFSYDREVYLGGEEKPNRLPPLRENIHDLIFVINPSSKEQLKVLFTVSKMVLDNSVPQQIGILPLVESELDEKLAKYLYYIYDTTTPQEALAILYKAYMRETDAELEKIFRTIHMGNYQFDSSVYTNTAEAFSFTEPSVVFNGIITSLQEEWRPQMARQIGEDVARIQQGISSGEVGLSVKKYLYQNARSERNLDITPIDSSRFMYKKVTEELVRESTGFKYDHGIGMSDDLEVWVIGDLSNEATLNTLVNVFEVMGVSSFDIQLRVIDTSTSGLLSKLQSGTLSDTTLEKNIDTLSSLKKLTRASKPDFAARKFVADQKLPPHHSFLLVNSRYFRLNKEIGIKDLESIAEFEQSLRLSIVDSFVPQYPEIFGWSSISQFYDPKTGFSFHDWKDLLVSRLTKSFHVDDTLHMADVGRYDFSSLNIHNSFVIDNSGEPLVDMFVVVDPMLQSAQEIVSIIESCIHLPFIRTRILLQPKQKYHLLPVNRYFVSSYPQYPLKFDSDGSYVDTKPIRFSSLPETETLQLDLLVPRRWSVMTTGYSEASPDNIKLEDLEEVPAFDFELKSVLVEGFAKDVKTAGPPSGLVLNASDGVKSVDTTVMANLGYFQLAVGAGTWKVQVAKDLGTNYDILSISSNPFDHNNEPQEFMELDVFTLDGLVLSPRFSEPATGLARPAAKKSNQETINIFTVASGSLYEKLASMMITSIRAHTNVPVKLWILENYLSPKFKHVLPQLAQKIGFEYEFVSYKWPNWLRRQFTRQRTVWAYKILFLDVLFPADIDQIIFVDADQINRSDMKELNDMDMGEAPYGFVPMCDSRPEMKPYRFWEQGYWAKMLQQDLKYHISALFKVNLHKFRQDSVADRLRSHYQQLSSDVSSLENLDQDLPNNMQRVVPIFSLPQEFLWCETWCSDKTLKDAKNIDLCNNPVKHEGKLETAQRLMPEWKEYEAQVTEVEKETLKKLKQGKEQEAEEDDQVEEDEQEDFAEDADDFDHDEL